MPILKRYNYGGSIYPVNPRQSEIDGHPCCASLSSLPEIPEVAALLVPNRVVPEVTEEAVRLKIPYIVVFSSGFEEIGDEGRHVRKRMREILKKSGTVLSALIAKGTLTYWAESHYFTLVMRSFP